MPLFCKYFNTGAKKNIFSCKSVSEKKLLKMQLSKITSN